MKGCLGIEKCKQLERKIRIKAGKEFEISFHCFYTKQTTRVLYDLFSLVFLYFACFSDQKFYQNCFSLRR